VTAAVAVRRAIRRIGLLAALVVMSALGGCAAFLPQSEGIRAAWPAKLGDTVELTAVPFYPQDAYQCGPAALAMLLGHDGIGVTPEEMVPKVYLPERRGSLQVEMIAAARPYGVVPWRLAPRLEDVLREVESGNPVIVLQDYGLWPVRVWHYAVVVGFDRTARTVVLRSGEKQRLELPFAVLEYTWKPSGYWSMVALPPDRIAATASQTDWAAAVAAMERVGRRSASRSAYRTLLARWPDSLTGAIGLANVAYAERDLAEAERVLQGAVAHHPDSAAALNNLAQVLSDRGRHDEALQRIDAAIARGGPLKAAAEATRAGIVGRLEAARRSEENRPPAATAPRGPS